MALLVAPVLAVGTWSVAAVGTATAHVTAQPSASQGVPPNPVNMMDCNGWSRLYKSADPFFKGHCVDPHGPLYSGQYGGTWSRFVDNHHYVGHDEPSVKFISSSAKSGNTMTYFMTVPKDPAMAATNNGSVVDYAQLSPAPWFGLPICDPRSYPQNPCLPDNNSNSGLITDSHAAGSAFMELQFYPPKFAPFADDVSCSATKWCAAMNIDSLESQFNFVNLNPNCTEPVNFAFLQTNGVPAGPPSPQLTNASTFLPNAHTLMMSAGDVLKVSITDPAGGFTTTIHDLTTNTTGTMQASMANGFKNTDFRTCNGFAHTFHAEYATAAQKNQVPWAALEGGVLMEQEIGHSEVCSSLANPFPVGIATITDKTVKETCVGGTEGGTTTKGEGPCNFTTGVCQGATTEGTSGPVACPSNNFATSGQLCEFSDGLCIPQGTRTVMINHVSIKETSPVNFCEDNLTQNGDLDFDGLSYQKVWPDGSSSHPTSVRYAGPFDQSGHTYPQIQFETDAPGSEFLCNISTGVNCDLPPLGAHFYPFWTLTNKAGQGVGSLFPTGACIWNFGNRITGVTIHAFNGAAQYGHSDLARYGGTATSPVTANPETSPAQGCIALTMP